MKLYKFIIAIFMITLGIMSLNSVSAESKRGDSIDNYENAALLKRPLVNAYVTGGQLKVGVFGLGPNHNASTFYEMRIKDSSGTSSYTSAFSTNACGSSEYIEATAPKTPNGEFTVELRHTSSGTTYTNYYFGIAGNNSVTYGKWTVTGSGLVGVIQNQFSSNTYKPENSDTYTTNTLRVDAVSVFGTLNNNLSVTSSYGSSVYGSTPLYELFKDCDYDTRSSTNSNGSFTNFQVKQVNFIDIVIDPLVNKPDLEVQSITSNTNASNITTICVNIKNLGAAATTRTAKIGLYIDPVVVAYPIFGTTPIAATLNVNSGLAPNSAQTPCYSTTLSTGNHTVYILVDKFNDIIENADHELNTIYHDSQSIYVQAPTPTPTPTKAPTPTPTPSTGHVKVYRFYNSKTKAHFFTKNVAERDILINTNPEWSYEAVAYYVINTNSSGNCNGTGGKPVYRFYGTPETGGNSTHFFTINGAEADAIKANDPKWRYEGISWCAQTSKLSGTTEVYRFGNILSNSHFYTINKAESDATKTNPEWRFEGVDYYTYTK